MRFSKLSLLKYLNELKAAVDASRDSGSTARQDQDAKIRLLDRIIEHVEDWHELNRGKR
jgi:hypothetical protein